MYYNEIGQFKGLSYNEVATEIARELGCDVGEDGIYGNVIITGTDDKFGNTKAVPKRLADDIINLAEMRCV